MSKEKMIAATRAILLTFALVSIGVFIGKEMSGTPSQAVDEVQDTEAQTGFTEPQIGSKVSVYIMHPTARCFPCRLMEAAAKELIDGVFAEQLAEGTVEFKSIDYLQNPQMARRYDIVGSSIVVAKHIDGEEVYSKLLSDAMVKITDREEFSSYLLEAILTAMGEGGE